MSRQIRDLEDELGFPLLERRAKSVRLTEAGRAFLIEARAVLRRTDDAVKAARAVATGGGELHAGYAPSLTARILPATLRAFQAELPRVRVKLHDMSTDEMLAGLRKGELHIAFVARPINSMLRGLRFEELLRDIVCVAVAPEHRFTGFRAATVEQLVLEPIIATTASIIRKLTRYCLRCFVVAETNYALPRNTTVSAVWWQRLNPEQVWP